MGIFNNYVILDYIQITNKVFPKFVCSVDKVCSQSYLTFLLLTAALVFTKTQRFLFSTR